MRRPALSTGLAPGAASNTRSWSSAENASGSSSSYTPSASAIVVAEPRARATSLARASVRSGEDGETPAAASLPRGDT